PIVDSLLAHSSLGRRTRRTLPDGRYDETTTYDGFGRTSSQTDFKGKLTQFVYEDATLVPVAERKNLGRLLFKRYFTPDTFSSGAGTPVDTVHYTYDALGRQQRLGAQNLGRSAPDGDAR